MSGLLIGFDGALTALTTINFILELFIYYKFIKLVMNLFQKSSLFETQREYYFILFLQYYSIIVALLQASNFYPLFVFRLYEYMNIDGGDVMNKRAEWYVILELCTRLLNILL